MYIAKTTLTVGVKGKPPRKVKPGDEIPEADHWDHAVIQSNLNMGWIEKVQEPQVALPKKKTGRPRRESAKQEDPPVDQAS